MMKSMMALALAGLATLAGTNAADASIVINITQDGSNVDFSANGSLEGDGLAGYAYYTGSSETRPSAGFVDFSDTGYELLGVTGFSGPLNWGTSSALYNMDAHGGTPFGFNARQSTTGMMFVYVDPDYNLGDPIASTGAIFNATLTGLGFTPGTYVYTAPGDTITVNIGAVPEPATWATFIGGFGLVGGALRAAKRRARIALA